MRRAVIAVAFVAGGVVLLACSRTAPTSGEIAFGASIEQARGHLSVAVEDAQLGRWDLAMAHAGHPAEAMTTIDPMIATKDAAAADRVRAAVADAARIASTRDAAAFRAAADRADGELAAALLAVVGETRAGDVAYRADVIATLIDLVPDEYGDGVSQRALTNEIEYQDAHAFLARAVAGWSGIEGAITQRSPEQAREVADALQRLRGAMSGALPPSALVDPSDVEALAHDVQRELREATGATKGTSTAGSDEILNAVRGVAQTRAALDRSDRAAAATAFTDFRSTWPRIEDAVRARDHDAYKTIETEMATAATLISSPSGDLAAASRSVGAIDAALTPLTAAPRSYGLFDAAIILLREGFEALLVIAALAAFLARSGNGDKRRWVWAGGAAGITASLLVAVGVTVAFSASTAAGLDPELIEGVTGVIAAAMLIYMSFWLHSKASLRAWDRYIRDRSASALARNSVLSLGAIAFLAVFREGTETVLFYFGIASSIAPLDLLGGLALGAVALIALGILILGLGVRVPVRPFFFAASALVYYLAFKFLGSGVHALQVVGIVPATPLSVPDIGIIGLFPTWETTAVQIVLLAAALIVILLGRVRVASLASGA